MISKTEMLDGFATIDYKITEVLYSWVEKEGNNLESFITTPSSHVEYSPYMVLDYTKLTERLSMLRDNQQALLVITEHKKGNPDYTGSMYESAVDTLHIVLMLRLLEWLEKRFADMMDLVKSTNKEGEIAPLDDYKSMFTFNQDKFLQECDMYAKAIEGTKIVTQYKQEQIVEETVAQPELLTSNEPPEGA